MNQQKSKCCQALELRERLSGTPDFTGASPNDRDLLTCWLLHFAVAVTADEDSADALVGRVFAAFRAARLGAHEVMELFELPQFSHLYLPISGWAQRATLADGAPIEPAFVCAQLERAAQLVGRLRAVKFEVYININTLPSVFILSNTELP